MKQEPDSQQKRRRPQPPRNANVRGNLQGNGESMDGVKGVTWCNFLLFLDSDSNDNSDVNAFSSSRSQSEAGGSSGKMQFNFLVELGEIWGNLQWVFVT